MLLREAPRDLRRRVVGAVVDEQEPIGCPRLAHNRLQQPRQVVGFVEEDDGDSEDQASAPDSRATLRSFDSRMTSRNADSSSLFRISRFGMTQCPPMRPGK